MKSKKKYITLTVLKENMIGAYLYIWGRFGNLILRKANNGCEITIKIKSHCGIIARIGYYNKLEP